MHITNISKLCVTAALLIPLTLHAAPLPEVLVKVLETHPDIRSASHVLEAAKARVTQAKSNFYPVVGLNYAFDDTSGEQNGVDTSSTTNRTDAILSWTVFNGFANRYGLATTKSQQKATEAELDATHEAIALEVTDAYLGLLRLTYRAARNKKYMNELKQLVMAIKTRAASGRLSGAEATQAESRLISAESSHSNLLAQLGAAKARFTELTGSPTKGLSYPKIDTQIVNQSLEELYALAKKHNPNLRASEYQTQAKKSEIGSATAEYYPTIALELRKRLMDDNDVETTYNEDTGGSVNVTYQIPFGGGAFGRKLEAEKQQLSSEEKYKSLVIDIHTSIAELKSQLQESLRIAPRLRQNIDASNQIYSAYELQFNAGRRSLLDLLSSLNEKHSTYDNVIDNWYQSTLMAAQLHALTMGIKSEVLSSESAGS